MARRAAPPSARTRAGPAWIISVGTFLQDARRNEWEPGLPPGAAIYHGDTPPKAPRNPRWIPEFLMRQLEAPEALARFPSDLGRVLVQILIACGLRLKDARTLPLDCVARDSAGAPYLAWLNLPEDERPGRVLPDQRVPRRQDRRAAAARPRRLPRKPRPFPARQANLDGHRHTSDGQFREELTTWLVRVELADEHGIPAKVTSHQFRHTVATRLINADVPQHIVQQLLDHMSPEMTAVYARLHLDTVRRHWESALKVNADGTPASLPDGHPLATAQWMRLSMVRAKVTLPNGYCGAPVQTDCEYANPCLDCRFFITTPDFLAQHRQQREETRQMIDQACQGAWPGRREQHPHPRQARQDHHRPGTGRPRRGRLRRKGHLLDAALAETSRYLAEASRRRHDQARDRAAAPSTPLPPAEPPSPSPASPQQPGSPAPGSTPRTNLRAAIAELMKRRPAPGRTAPPAAASDESLRRRLEASQASGKKLREDNTDLRRRLEAAHEEIRLLRTRATDQTGETPCPPSAWTPPTQSDLPKPSSSSPDGSPQTASASPPHCWPSSATPPTAPTRCAPTWTASPSSSAATTESSSSAKTPTYPRHLARPRSKLTNKNHPPDRQVRSEPMSCLTEISPVSAGLAHVDVRLTRNCPSAPLTWAAGFPPGKDG